MINIYTNYSLSERVAYLYRHMYYCENYEFFFFTVSASLFNLIIMLFRVGCCFLCVRIINCDSLNLC